MAGRAVLMRKVKKPHFFPGNFKEDLCADMLIL